MRSESRCQSCGSKCVDIFYEAQQVPVHSCMLLPNREEALRFPRRNIALGLCQACGFISNVLFDPQAVHYSDAYEDQQAYSTYFNSFARELANRLIERHNLRGKDVIEIGCGKGDFLALLCELGDNRGLGIDPTYVHGRLDNSLNGRIRFIAELYSERHASYHSDFLCCRHTLEHIPNTAEFVGLVRRVISGQHDTVVFFEVPDVIRVLRDLAFWDIYYEHCSYFSLGSLARLFRSEGFEVLDLAKDFHDQYLLLEARVANGRVPARLAVEEEASEIEKDVAHFQRNCASKVNEWRDRLERIRREGRRAAIWGSGSKCVAFLAQFAGADEIGCIVDINPYRHGKYLAGSGRQIEPPAVLRKYRPDTVIAMNPVYCDEIRRDLDQIGLSAEVIGLE